MRRLTGRERGAMNRRKLSVAAGVVIAAGALAFTLSALAQGHAPVPKGSGIGATQQGAAGFDAGDINMQDGLPVDFGTVISLSKPAHEELTDDDVVVVASQCSTVFPAVPSGCSGSSSDEDTTKCPSTWANGQLPDNPQAKKNTLCVYVLNGQDIGTSVGGGEIHGVSIVAGSGGSTLGGKVVWTPEAGDDAFWEGVWAYNTSK
jgi:hypothetical protein